MVVILPFRRCVASLGGSVTSADAGVPTAGFKKSVAFERGKSKPKKRCIAFILTKTKGGRHGDETIKYMEGGDKEQSGEDERHGPSEDVVQSRFYRASWTRKEQFGNLEERRKEFSHATSWAGKIRCGGGCVERNHLGNHGSLLVRMVPEPHM
ncbi:hypothetical protein B0H19DRAFT_1070201 [Mycena capillaripes]|nr:hypothetical protein B0H19DRAFT_1070201 [Mycena capillaripes]